MSMTDERIGVKLDEAIGQGMLSALKAFIASEEAYVNARSKEEVAAAISQRVKAYTQSLNVVFQAEGRANG